MKAKLSVAALVALSCLQVYGKDVHFFTGNALESSMVVSNVTTIKIGTDRLTLKSVGNTSTDVNFADFSAFAFKDKRTSGIENVEVANDVSLMFKGGEVTITSAETIDTINVYAVNGGLVATYAPASAHFSFAVEHGGLYVVKVAAGGNTKVFKVVK